MMKVAIECYSSRMSKGHEPEGLLMHYLHFGNKKDWPLLRTERRSGEG
jgi:hypothetical protein